MKFEDINLLCDPLTRESLNLENAVYEGDEIISGILRSSSGSYIIRNGIPRFVNDQGYSDNFGYQWNKWARIQFDDQNIGGPMEGYTTNMFKVITNFSNELLLGKTVLDIGCGPGRFTDVALKMGGRLIALDYSSAIDAARDNFINQSKLPLFIQGDALQMPIKSECVDYCYSIGVLHHTPSPETGVNEAFRVLRKNGKFAIRVYESSGFYTYKMVVFWRFLFVRVKPLLGYYPALFYSYFFGTIGFTLGKIWRPLSYPLRAIFPTAWLPDYRWTILDTFDAIATTHQSGHTPFEIKSWLKRAGFTKITHVFGNDFVSDK